MEGVVKTKVRGLSMFPTIRPGESVFVAPLEREPKRGDILFFKDNQGRSIMHRVVKEQNQEGQWVVMGDGYGRRFDLLSSEQILGQATFVERGGKWLPLASKRPWGFLKLFAFGYYWMTRLWYLLKSPI